VYESDEDNDQDRPGTKPGNEIKTKALNLATFKDFLLKEEILRAISDTGFENPSAV